MSMSQIPPLLSFNAHVSLSPAFPLLFCPFKTLSFSFFIKLSLTFTEEHKSQVWGVMNFIHSCINIHNIRIFNAVGWVSPPVGASTCSAS